MPKVAEQLPMGWAVVEPCGIPSDAGTPENEWERTANPRKPRRELRRWVRGGRYVRLCLCEEQYFVHIGSVRDEKDNWVAGFSLDEAGAARALVKARTLMRIGGRE